MLISLITGVYGGTHASLQTLFQAAIILSDNFQAFFLITWTITLTGKYVDFKYFGWHPLLETLALVCFSYGMITLHYSRMPHPYALMRHFDLTTNVICQDEGRGIE